MTVDGVLLPTYRGMVYPWHCDHMGHMNVMWYVGKFDEASWHLLAALGAGPTYQQRHERGFVALEQHTRYHRESRAGSLVTISSGVTEIRNKVLRLLHEMRNGESGDLLATMRLTVAHLDASSRRTCALPINISEAARGLQIEEPAC